MVRWRLYRLMLYRLALFSLFAIQASRVIVNDFIDSLIVFILLLLLL